MNIKISSLFFAPVSMFLLLFTQCNDIEYNRRILIKGNVSDANNIPLNDVSVYTSVGSNSFFGESVTNESGDFELVSLASNSFLLSLIVQLPEEFQFQYQNQDKIIDQFSIPLPSFRDQVLEINNIKVYPFAEVKINFVRESDGFLDYSIARNIFASDQEINYTSYENFDYSQEITPFVNRFHEGSVGNTLEHFTIQEVVQKNEIYQLSYKVQNQEIQTLFLNINEDYNEFEISF